MRLGRLGRLLAIDPGPTESAYVVINDKYRPLKFDKVSNDEMLVFCSGFYGESAVEMIASYGMPVGADVFQTCVWIGRFDYALLISSGMQPDQITRQTVKVHHCHSVKARDSNVRQALVDRFAPGECNYGKGTKRAPGFFYGFSKDVWQAYALAVYVMDVRLGTEP